MTMHFVSEAHRGRYETLSDRAQAGDDREYQSALYVLAALDKDLEQFVGYWKIDFPALKRASRQWSSGEKAMIKLAANLFNNTSWRANITDVFCPLGRDFTQVALEGLRLRYQF